MQTLPPFPRRTVFARVVLAVLPALLPVLAGLASLPADAQSFAQPALLATGNHPAAIYTADLNGDGFADLVYLDQGATPNQASTAHVLLNDGKGDFKQSAAVAVAGDSIAIGDFDGDGRLDLAWIDTPSGVGAPGNQLGTHLFLARGHGDGTFEPAFASPQITGGTAVGAIKTSPLYGFLTSARLYPAGPDTLICEVLGDPAATGPHYLPTLLTYRLTSNPSVIATSSATLPGNGPVALGDLNGDGLPDIVVNSSAAKSATAFLTDSNGLSHAISGPSTTAAGGISSLLLKDVNQDGRADLIAEGQNGHLDVFFGNGDGTFQTTSSGGTGPLDGLTGNGGHLIAVADINHDGLLDALTATPAGISSLLGQGTAYLGLKGIYNAGPGRTSFAVADFNGDGNLDLAVDSPEGIAILYGNADGSFQTSQAYAAGAPAMSLALAPFVDSKLDAVVSISDVQAQFLRGDGQGAFLSAGASGAPLPTPPGQNDPKRWSIALAGDFDGDGRQDVALVTQGFPSDPSHPLPANDILYGRGDGIFDLQPSAGFGGQSDGQGMPAAGDFNGDGRADILLPTYNAVFSDEVDGDPLGRGFYVGLIPKSANPNYSHFNPAAAGFFRGSRHTMQDVVIADGTQTLLAYQNDQTGVTKQNGGSFSQHAPFVLPLPASAAGLQTSALQIADLDGDGFGDVVALYHNPNATLSDPTPNNANKLYVYWGNGDGTFQQPLEITPARNFYLVKVADLDLDGHPDLILADGSVVSVLHGLGNRQFGPEQHLLAGQGINDIGIADVNGDGVPDLVFANGGAVLTSAFALGYKPGDQSVTLPVNPDVNTGGITVLLNPAKPRLATVTGTLTASPEPQPFEAALTLTLALNGTGGTTPTGNVTFMVDGKPAGSGSLFSGSVTVPGPAQLLPGTHTLTAAYAGDTTYAAANLTGSHTVLLGPTTTTLTATTPLTVYYGQGIDGTFAITQVDATNFPLTGTITLLDNGVAVPICTRLPYVPPTASGGGTSCPYGNPILLDAGPHSFQVSYNGDPVNAASTSAPVNYQVLQDTTTTGILASAAQVTQGQSITFSSVVVGNAASPVGAVNYLDGANVFATGALTTGPSNNSTNSTASAALGVGTHTITACYVATTDFGASCSGPITITVKAAIVPVSSNVSLTSSLNPSVFGNSVTFTAQVGTGAQSPTPTGTVTFMDGGATLGMVNLSTSAAASFTTSGLTVGTHIIKATYNGDMYTLSSSGILTQTVVAPAGAPGFTLTVSPTPVSIGVGRTAVLLVSVKDLNGFSQPVALTCTGLPGESACIFIQTAIAAGGGSTTLDVTTAAPHDCGDPAHPYFLGRLGGSGGVLAASLLGGLGLVFLPLRRRRGMKLLLGLAALGSLASLSGCGHCTDLGTYPGTYTFTVTGTAQGGPVTQAVSQQVQMTLTLP